MKKTPILFLSIMLSVTPFVRAQQIADVFAKNDGGMLLSLAEGTFNPDRPTDGTQDFSLYPRGTMGTLSNNPYDPSDTEWLYYEALKWDNVNPQFALDTMRLFVEREPHYLLLAENGLGYTETFVAENYYLRFSSGETVETVSIAIEH